MASASCPALFLCHQNASLPMIPPSDHKPQNPHESADPGTIPATAPRTGASRRLHGRLEAFHLGPDWGKEPLSNLLCIPKSWVPLPISHNPQRPLQTQFRIWLAVHRKRICISSSNRESFYVLVSMKTLPFLLWGCQFVPVLEWAHSSIQLQPSLASKINQQLATDHKIKMLEGKILGEERMIYILQNDYHTL